MRTYHLPTLNSIVVKDSTNNSKFPKFMLDLCHYSIYSTHHFTSLFIYISHDK